MSGGSVGKGTGGGSEGNGFILSCMFPLACKYCNNVPPLSPLPSAVPARMRSRTLISARAPPHHPDQTANAHHSPTIYDCLVPLNSPSSFSLLGVYAYPTSLLPPPAVANKTHVLNSYYTPLASRGRQAVITRAAVRLAGACSLSWITCSG